MNLGQSKTTPLMAWPKNDQNYAKLVIWLIALSALWRIWAGAMVGFGIGEAYYLASSRVLHLSYFDQPPLFLWVLWFTNLITPGEAPVLLRLPFILMFSLSTWVIYRIGSRVQSQRAGWLAALLFNIVLLFQISIGGWAQPEAPLMLFWLLTVWFLLDILADNTATPMRSWAWVGLMLGLTFLSKYHAVFLIYGTFLYTLVAPTARKWIIHPGPYLAIAIAALVASPILIWNWQNEFISFTFQGGRALGDDFSWARLARMVVGQLVYITPWIALPALTAAAVAIVKGPGALWPNSKQRGIAFIFVMLAHGPIVLFTAVAAWSDTQYHFHWQAPGYMMLFLLLAMWMDKAWARRKSALIAFLTLATIINFTAMGILITHTSNGWLRQIMPGFEIGIDPTTDALPWTELNEFLAQEGALETGNFVAGAHWIECGHVDNATQGKVPFLCISNDPRNIAFNVDPTSLKGQTGYIATSSWPDATIIEEFSPLFDTFQLIGEVDIVRSGRPERAVRIFKGENLRASPTYGPSNDGHYAIPLLPLVKITSMSGTADPALNGVQIALELDGHKHGETLIEVGRFTLLVQMDATLPRRTVDLKLTQSSGEPLALKTLQIDTQFHR